MSAREAFGPNLRRARVQAGVSLRTIVEATNVNEALWEGLERNDFSRWPNGISARAFVRGLRRPEGQLPDGCDTTAWRRLRDEWWLAWRVWLGRRSERERELAIVARHGSHAALHVLRSKGAIRAFLDHA